MKSIKALYNSKKNIYAIEKNSSEENWIDVCEKFNNDVHRISDVSDNENYSGIYECFDDDNNSFFYFVEESSRLKKLKRKTFFDNIGFKES